MSYKTMFVPVVFEDQARELLDTALRLAARFDAHVMASHLRQLYEYYPPMAYYPLAVELPKLASQKHHEAATAFARNLRSIFDEACDAVDARIVPLGEALKQTGVTASWTDAPGMLPGGYGLAARVADITIFPIPGHEGPAMGQSIFESLLITSGRPILLLPPGGLQQLPQSVLVGWDGSLQATRAIEAATPMLERAKETMVVTIGETDPGTPDGEAAAAYLRRRGVTAHARKLDWPNRPIAERLLTQAEAHGCDLVVMGGYSHARMYESLLGGVTSHMLKHADRALLIAH